MQICLLILASAIPLVAEAVDINREVLAQFRQYSPEKFGQWLDLQRPAAVTPQLASAIRAKLPKENEVRRLTSADGQKLESISAVLRAHDREGVYLVKVVDIPQARVGLHARFVVLVTRTALRILSAGQLQALVAHEIGHEYVWLDYESARAKGNSRRLRSLELFCDGVALVTLARIGAEPETLIDALRLLDFADRRNGLVLEYSSHPTLPDREDFARQIRTWLDAGSTSARAHVTDRPMNQGDRR
jgi:hypothetical protein